MIRRVFKVALWLLLALVFVVGVLAFANRDVVQRTLLGGLKVYETVPPSIPADLRRPAILVFSKTNGFRHEEAIPAANTMLRRLAEQRGWGFFQTENGAAFSPEILARFDAVVFNNASGDLFIPAQRAAFRAFVEGGGGFVGIHAAGDSSHHGWAWYADQMIGARFTAHPLNPQFQPGKITVADPAHPATRGLPGRFSAVDEWYFFAAPPPAPFRVLARLDESSLINRKALFKDLSMGADHPVAWWRCTGKGRVFYAAPGHVAAAYAPGPVASLLTGGVDWAMGSRAGGCAG